MKNISKLAIFALVISSLSLESCKKGDGDPFLSLRSRKARVAGDWKVSSGSGTDINGSSTVNWTYNGTNYSESGASTLNYGLTIEYTFDKDGTWSSKQVQTTVIGTLTITATRDDKGTWNFTSGVGDAKNKSQIVLTTTQSISTSGATTETTTYTGSDAPSIIVDIYQLKNKEMIWKFDGTTTSTLGNGSTKGEYTLTAKE